MSVCLSGTLLLESAPCHVDHLARGMQLLSCAACAGRIVACETCVHVYIYIYIQMYVYIYTHTQVLIHLERPQKFLYQHCTLDTIAVFRKWNHHGNYRGPCRKALRPLARASLGTRPVTQSPVMGTLYNPYILSLHAVLTSQLRFWHAHGGQAPGDQGDAHGVPLTRSFPAGAASGGGTELREALQSPQACQSPGHVRQLSRLCLLQCFCISQPIQYDRKAGVLLD